MKYAIMSDVHANPAALRTALADAKKLGCRKFVFLGDVTGYGYDVKSALRLVRGTFDVVLMGNHDSACIGLEPPLETLMMDNYDIDREQRQVLTKEEAEWLRKLPYSYTLEEAAFVHGDFINPKKWNYILTCESAVRNFLFTTEQLMFCAHTHHAAVWEQTKEGEFRSNDEKFFNTHASRPDSLTFTPKKESRYIINVGSVGYPRNDLCITYGIWDTKTDEVSIRRLLFDFKGYLTSLVANNVAIPHWLEPILLTLAQKIGLSRIQKDYAGHSEAMGRGNLIEAHCRR